MSTSTDHDRRALGIAVETLRKLASDRLYSDAFRHRIMDTVPNVGHDVRLLLYSSADRLEALQKRLAPPDTPAARLARHRAAKRRTAAKG